MPQETPLTDTELIELASMVEDLQDSLISSYYNYKNTLSQLKDTRSKMICTAGIILRLSPDKMFLKLLFHLHSTTQ